MQKNFLLRKMPISGKMNADRFLAGPRDGCFYPKKVSYCGNCTLPIELCEYHPEYEKCKAWLAINLPDEFTRLKLSYSPTGLKGETEDIDNNTRQCNMLIRYKKRNFGAKKINVVRASRGKRKFTTVINGLGKFDIDLKVAAKFFGSKFACGASVTGPDEISLQGDFKDQLRSVIPTKWPEIKTDAINELGKTKR